MTRSSMSSSPNLRSGTAAAVRTETAPPGAGNVRSVTDALLEKRRPAQQKQRPEIALSKHDAEAGALAGCLVTIDGYDRFLAGPRGTRAAGSDSFQPGAPRPLVVEHSAIYRERRRMRPHA